MFKKLLLTGLLFTTLFAGNAFAVNGIIPLSDEVFEGIRNDVIAIDSQYPEAGIISNGNVDTGKHDSQATKVGSAKLPSNIVNKANEPENKKENDCTYNPDATGSDADIRRALENCVGNSSLVQVEDAYVTGGLKDVLNGWIQKIAGFLALGAIFAIAFGSLKLTLSMGEDENIKKAKDIIKWGIIGFIAVISAGFLIALVVNLIYSLAG